MNIFKFIEKTLSLPRNNATKTFEKFSDIESWLREQWAGLFRDLLQRMSEQKKFTELSHQVDGLKEINTTLKTYLESVMQFVSPDKSSEIIKSEHKRLDDLHRIEQVKTSDLGRFLNKKYGLPVEIIIEEIVNAKSGIGFAKSLSKYEETGKHSRDIVEVFEEYSKATDDLRKLFDLSSLRKPPKKSSNKQINKD